MTTQQTAPILLTRQKEDFVCLILNRPSVLNALNRPLLLALKNCPANGI